jgi:hypothetical protein
MVTMTASGGKILPVPRFDGELVIRALRREELKQLASKWRRGVQLYEVSEDFTFVSQRHGPITAERRFVTDFGSVPWFALWLVDDDDPDLLFAALPHDKLYDCGGDLGDGRKLSRRECDEVLWEAMEACGAPRWKRGVVYGSVRLFGWWAWRRSTAEARRSN